MSSSSELEAKFRKAAWLIANGPKNESASTEYKLDFYSHFKQATEGDVTGSQPWMTQLQARAKWDAWNKLKGMSKEDAMKKYIALVAAGDSNWEQHESFKDYKP